VTGSQTETGTEGTELGMFTIFDLSGQKLGRSTVLHLPESNFRYLYFGITGPVKPNDVQGLSVQRVAMRQPFVAVAAPEAIVQQSRQTRATFMVPAHVPVERVHFAIGKPGLNFSRDVTVRVVPVAAGKQMTDEEPVQPAEFTGNLLRVHETRDGTQINEERMGVAAPYGELDTASRWTVTIENGDDPPLDVTSVLLEMAKRNLCFDAVAGAGYTLFYGDAALQAPQYDYARLFTPEQDAAQATLAPEKANPLYVARPDTRPFTDRYPWLLWVALVLVVALLGAVAFRTAKETAPPR
jgi:hypothetical protein